MKLKFLFYLGPCLLLDFLCDSATALSGDARHPHVLKPNAEVSPVTPLPGTKNSSLTKRAVSCSAYHAIQSGDTCWDIKNRYGTTLDRIYELNQGINCDALWIGGRVCVAENPPPPPPPATACSNYLTIASGDICYDIANRLHMSLNTLLSLNPGLDCDKLRIDQQICVQGGTAPLRQFGFVKRSTLSVRSEAHECTKFHTVKSGDSCWNISHHYGLDLSKFLRVNPSLNCDPLQIGQMVCVQDTTPKVSCIRGHSVQAGDTCFKIANKYSMKLEDLVAKNPGLNCDLLQIRQKVCVSERVKTISTFPTPTTYNQATSVKPPNAPKYTAPTPTGHCTHFFSPSRQLDCNSVSKGSGLQSISDLIALNPGLDCTRPVTINDKLCVRIPESLVCTEYYIATEHDTEQSISSLFHLEKGALKALNQEMSMPSITTGQFVCVQTKRISSLFASVFNCQ